MDMKPHMIKISTILMACSISFGQNFSLYFEGGDHVAVDDQSIEEIFGSNWSSRKSISAWIIPTGQSPNVSEGWNGQQIYGQDQAGDGFGNTHGISRGIIDGLDRIWVYNWDGEDDRIGIEYEVDELLHVALVHDENMLYAYKNGTLVGQILSYSTSDGGFIRIGGGTENGNDFNGHIDEVRAWNIVRSSEDIYDQMYMQLSGEEQNLVGYWNFNEGDGLIAYDLTSNQNHGDINGASYSTLTFDPCDNDEIHLWNDCYSIDNTTEIILPSQQLVGQIPNIIGDFSNLTSLILSNNDLTGPIPVEIGNLTELEVLDLSGNQLTGSIPNEIGDLSQLSMLNLYFNDLDGELPERLQDITNLRHLDLSGNQLTGSIHNAVLQDTDSLTYLNLSFNQFSDAIPSSMGELDELRYLFLNNNSLSGSLPLEMFELNDLRYFWLSSNQISGVIPQEISALTSLQQLFMNDNDLTGLIPSEICELSIDWDGQPDIGLDNFNIANNDLCPPYPSCISEHMGYQDTTHCSSMASITDDHPLNGYDLYDAFPNPFNPATTISYEIYQMAVVEIIVHDILGRPIKYLLMDQQYPGMKKIQWNGKDDRGSQVPSGTYLYTIKIDGVSKIGKLVLLK